MGHKIKSLEGQTLWDIALIEYGSIDGVFVILKDNPALDLDVDLAPNTIILINSDPLDKDVVNYYKEKNINPATQA